MRLELLELEVDVTSLGVVTGLEAVDFDAELGDAVLISGKYRVVLTREEAAEVRRHGEANEGEDVGREERCESAVEQAGVNR